MSARTASIYSGFLAAIAAAVWFGPEERPRQDRQPRHELGQFYAVDVASPRAALDLEFDPASRYELIVSSLGDAARKFRVCLKATSKTRVESSPGVRVARLKKSSSRRSFRPDACPPASDATITGTAQRRFYLHVADDSPEDPRGYVPVAAQLVAEGRRVRVYLDRQESSSGSGAALIDEIVRLLDDEIIPRSMEILGEHADVDDDGKLAVLVTPWLARLCGGKTSLKGCVRSSDFIAGAAAPFGNHADLIYLNSDLAPGPMLKAVLAHEYTHAVCFSRRLASTRRGPPLPAEDDWLNEAIAHVAENLHNAGWSNLDHRIERFLEAPQNSPLAVCDYYRAGLWRDPGCRGATYLFLQFCVDRFGEQLLHDLVEGAASGRRNIERATGTDFSELFRQWTLALAEDEISSVPLRGRLRSRKLSGLARIAWNVDHGPCEVDLCGTATSIVALDRARGRGVVRVSIESERGACLQVTLVPRSK